ncbi:MAG TPA: exosortase K [Blastocatellia bacterium]|nr:exosortase K [Blastocatellia bacterium]
MNLRFNWTRIAQCVVALAGALALKLHYSTASADQLRWILAPTAALVEMVSGASFEFESRAGYISRERGFLIANSCAGVNFLIAAFLTLSMRKLLGDRSKGSAWGFLPIAAIIAYLTTLVANTTRITIALLLRQSPAEIGPVSGPVFGHLLGWMNPDQLHRFEGVFIYFGFLLLLFVVSEKMSAGKTSGSLRRLFLPLIVYYAIALGLPLLNGAYRQGADFWRHALFVLLIPLLLTLSSLIFRRVVPVTTSGALRQ